MRKPKNPRAFPVTSVRVGDVYEDGAQGMTLRDYIATQALTGYVAATGSRAFKPQAFEEASQIAYAYADAMLTTRERECLA